MPQWPAALSLLRRARGRCGCDSGKTKKKAKTRPACLCYWWRAVDGGVRYHGRRAVCFTVLVPLKDRRWRGNGRCRRRRTREWRTRIEAHERVIQSFRDSETVDIGAEIPLAEEDAEGNVEEESG
ncbi:hypothetical protein C8R44DRAFT_330306 [Mycena epipterygia]|nr:hypothetical protein C8R44DRAFT_330306 [Mycena epipterygia]